MATVMTDSKKPFSMHLLTANPFLKRKLEQMLPQVSFSNEMKEGEVILLDEPWNQCCPASGFEFIVLTNNQPTIKADLYIQKPLKPSTLKRKLLEYLGNRQEDLLAGLLRLNKKDKRVVHINTSHAVDLTDKEYDLLACFMEFFPNACDKETLLKKVWGYNENIETRTLETHIYRLRQKLKSISENEDLLVSTDEGYVLKC